MSPISKRQAKYVVGAGILAVAIGLLVFAIRPREDKPPVSRQLLIRKSKYTTCRPEED